jgi:intracellular sulfur oxidation DsrE/DsrF family protein
MPFKMKYKNLKDVVGQLRSAVVAHGKQADIIEKHIDKMDSPAKAKAKGIDGKACWKGYSLRGTKMKGGKRVDNCVKN